MSRKVLGCRELNRLSASDKNPPTIKSHYRRFSSDLKQFAHPIPEFDTALPEKALNFPLSPERPQHRRQPSIIIKEASQTYSFASILGCMMESNEELNLSPLSTVSVDYKPHTQPTGSLVTRQSHNSKQGREESCRAGEDWGTKESFAASTIEPKSSFVHSEMKSSVAVSDLGKRLSTIYTGSCESTNKPQALFDNKPASAFNYETQVQVSGTFCSSSFGMLPTKAFCMRCNKEVGTRVTVQLAKLPL
jgi:hypothetical protein